MQKKSFAAISTALAAVLMISTGSPAYAADAADGSKMTVQQMRQPIPLSLNKVSKVLGQPDVYVYDCNPEDIYEKSHLKGSIHANKADWMNLLPKDKKNSFVILYCINRMCTVSFEAALEAIKPATRMCTSCLTAFRGGSPTAIPLKALLGSRTKAKHLCFCSARTEALLTHCGKEQNACCLMHTKVCMQHFVLAEIKQ